MFSVFHFLLPLSFGAYSHLVHSSILRALFTPISILKDHVHIFQYPPEKGCLGSKFVETLQIWKYLLCRILSWNYLPFAISKACFLGLIFRVGVEVWSHSIPDSLCITWCLLFCSWDSCRVFALSPVVWNLCSCFMVWILLKSIFQALSIRNF